jgi:thiamine transport system permease protein
MPSSADRSRNHRVRLLAVPGLVMVVALVILPVVALGFRTIDSSALFGVWSRPGIVDALGFTLLETILSTAVTVVLGLAPAWALSHHSMPGHRYALALTTVPFMLPTVVVGAAFLGLLPGSVERGLVAVVIAHAYFNIAVVIRTVAPVWATIDPMLVAAARNLGASRLRAFTTVTLPLLRPALSSAVAIIGFMCATSYGVVRMLGGGSATLEVEVYRRAILFGDVAGASTLAVAQMAVAAICLLVWTGKDRIVFTDAGHRSRRREHPAARIVTIVTATVTLVPLVALVLSSVRSRGHWTLAGWRLLTEGSTIPGLRVDLPDVLTRSLFFAVIAAAIAVPIGIATSTATSSGRTITDRVLMFPLGASAVAVGLGIVITYDSAPFDFRSSWWLAPVVHAVVALPFVIRVIQPVHARIPPHLRSVAATLGASPARVWATVDVPLISGAIRTAVGLSLAVSLGEFGATSFLSRNDTDTLPIAVERLLARSGDLARLAGHGVAVVLLMVTVVALAFTTRSRNSWNAS